jgi:hypothetical protein
VDKIDDVKDSFYEEFERVFDKFLKYGMKDLLGDFLPKLVGETFSNQQLRMKVYAKLVMIMKLEY